MILKIVLALAAVLVSGCAATYQKAGHAGGFKETQLSENVWRVSFSGNGYTRSERAEDFALLRSADLTLLNGFTYFALANSRNETNVSSYTTPITATTKGSKTRYYGGDTVFVSIPTANNTVVMYKAKPDTAMAFDARFICASLGKKYEVSCEALKPAPSASTRRP